ncbi:alpha-galactosidase [Lactobacillus colini]|uniref:Alpha-galactosidase n=1 Tax=Lactobacillus colini TaxID=1819254 RepID=A0ABS4MF28_9LACO|nr:alpha-galactosidase [Lactobacillus colini]MBP2057946.1 alpha-galactosidase [Lactobacillus colini]
MIDVIDNKYFNIYNDKISYIFYIMPNNQLGHLYYGASLGKLGIADLKYLSDHSNRSAEITEYDSELKDFSLGDRMQEYPVFGTSDYREGMLDLKLGQEIIYTDFKFNHYKVTHGKARKNYPVSYGDNSDNLVIDLIDEDHKLELQLLYTIYSDSSAIVRSNKIHNLSLKVYQIENIQSLALDIPKSDFDFLQLSGAWIKERHIKKRNLEQGITKIESLRGGSGHQNNPFIALVAKNVDLSNGEIYASNLIYSGNFVSQVQVDAWNTSRLMTGINPSYFEWKLEPGQTFTSPEAVLFYTKDGYNGLMNETHLFVKEHIISKKWHNKARPIVINNWEATYFDFSEDKLLSLATKTKSLGIECFVLDDGWFGQRNNDTSSLGNWTVNKQKFPHGLKHFGDKIHDLGMQFGLWFEPEMVSPDAPIYQKHPNWIVHHPYSRYSIGRNQYVLDFSNPQVVDNIFNQMCKILDTVKIDYIKWDMNRHISEAYSPYLKKKSLPQGEFYYRYIQGVYHLYHKLLTRYPNLLIEGCASGGGRFDLGIMYYSPQVWPSDDSDAGERLDILTGTMLAYPLSVFSNHVSAVPNEQTGRITNLKFRQEFNSFGLLGYELDLNKLSTNEQEEIKQHIAWYKQYRNLLTNGNFSQLIPLNNKNEYAWSCSNEKEILIGFYRKLVTANESLKSYIPLKNINDQALYRINGQNIISGKILSKIGLQLPYQLNGWNKETAQLSGDFQSHIFVIKQVD